MLPSLNYFPIVCSVHFLVGWPTYFASTSEFAVTVHISCKRCFCKPMLAGNLLVNIQALVGISIKAGRIKCIQNRQSFVLSSPWQKELQQNLQAALASPCFVFRRGALTGAKP